MIKYSKIEEKDLDQIIKLYNEHLNSGQWIEESIREGFQDRDYIGYKAECDGEIIGFFSGRSGIDFTYPHPDLEKRILQIAQGAAMYTPDALLVLPHCRQKGVAHALISRMYQRMMQLHYKLAIVELWIYPDGTVPAQNPLTGLGKTIFSKRIPMFYQKSKQYEIQCPICGEDCKCGALIEIISLDA